MNIKEHLKFGLKVFIALAFIFAILDLMGSIGLSIKTIWYNPVKSISAGGLSSIFGGAPAGQ